MPTVMATLHIPFCINGETHVCGKIDEEPLAPTMFQLRVYGEPAHKRRYILAVTHYVAQFTHVSRYLRVYSRKQTKNVWEKLF